VEIMNNEMIINKIDENVQYWNKRAKDFNESINTEDRKNRVQNLVKTLLDKEMINSESSILDIGC